LLFCVFFFSSRRRHTRFSRDWSSDVCSSDLDGNGTPDVSFVSKTPANPKSGVSYVVIDGIASKLSQGTKGHIIWRDDEDRQFDDKKYLRPISNADLVINPDLGQNPDW